MSNQQPYPGPEQPEQPAGTQPPPGYGVPGQAPPPAGAPGPPAPPPGYQAPGYQAPPPGYQAPPQYQAPGQQPPGQQGPPAGNFTFEMPQDMPHSMNDVMPVGGFSGIFKTAGLPQLLKISYIIWLVTAGLGILFNIIGMLGSLLFLGLGSGSAARGFVSSVISLAVMVAVVICAMKLKEGMQWARMALSAMVVLSIILVPLGASGTGLLGIVAAVLMWLPESSAWLKSHAGGVR